MTVAPPIDEGRIAAFRDDFDRLRSAMDEVIVGQSELVVELLTAVLAGGHVLIEGPPGLGKTNLVKALCKATGMSLSRIQCTPDLMPADITGSEVLVESDAGRPRHLEFRPGPVFASVVLVDEINRATPRSQSALLEAMQERQVTYAGNRHALPSPFWVLATQNPIEFEGTYPLPEAQLDRFMAKLCVGYPAREDLPRLVMRTLDQEPADGLAEVLDEQRLQAMMGEARTVVLPGPVVEAASDLVLATHPEAGGPAGRHLRYGASPRALQAMLRLARIRALAEGRAHISVEDVAKSALPALRHRVLLAMESELTDVAVEAVVADIVAAWVDAWPRRP